MTGAPQFSVVIPARSPAPDLPATLASVAAQTYPAAEVIVVDDGLSPEERAPAVATSTIRGRALGAAAARNDGVRAAGADWIAFLDSDDLWYPEHLERMADAISRSPGVGLCFGAAVHESDAGKAMARFIPSPRHATARGLLTRRLQPTASATAARRDAVLDVGGFYEGFSHPAAFEDTDLWWRLAMAWPCAVQEEPSVTYKVHVDRNQARDHRQLVLLSRDRRTCIARVRERVSGPLARRAAAQHLAILARYWYIAGFGSAGRREAVESLLWWPTLNGAASLGFGLIPRRWQ